MRGIDSNIIVYALNEDLPEHAFCKELLKIIINEKEIVSVPSIVFMESFHALVKAYKYKESEVKKRLIAIIDSRNVNILDITTSTILLAFEIAEKFETGGRDSLIAASLLENKVQEIYSHDSDFDKISLLKRLDPIPK
ncbi:MAG: type II toxin-antitoxin system VapC family toxin [Candidatus Lokiarchaeota archaeon]|nr:type II toxin-antitoxin system VapC family toxin [Candidatus Lokiarchaeota archaeon]